MKAPVETNRQRNLGRGGDSAKHQFSGASPCISVRPAKASSCNQTDRVPASPRARTQHGPGCVAISSTKAGPVTGSDGTLRDYVRVALAQEPAAERRLLAVLALCGVALIWHCAVSVQGLLANWSVFAHWVLNAISLR